MSLIINPNVARGYDGRCLDCQDSGLRFIASYSVASPSLFSTLSRLTTNAVYETCPCRIAIVTEVVVP